MTAEQILWASEHDWFIRSEPCIGNPGRFVAVVRNDVAPINGPDMSFVGLLSLRAWAGY